MNQTLAVKEFLICRTIVALSAGLLNGGNVVVLSVMTKLPSLGALRLVLMIAIVKMAFTVVVAVVTVIVAPLITTVVIATRWAIRPGHLGDVFPMSSSALAY